MQKKKRTDKQINTIQNKTYSEIKKHAANEP